jgi:ABC-type multidrug transport system ATPase subunit
MSAIRLHKVNKRYGSRSALLDMSFEVPTGAICGLIGPNGAGKTTTMGLLGGLLRHQGGEVDILGQGEFAAERHAGKVSLMPQDCSPSEHMSLRDILTYYAKLQGIEGSLATIEADKRLSEVFLQDRASSKYGALSHGMRRRFSIAQALLGDPQLVMLDEPTSGLDPELVVQIRKHLAQKRGQTTLLVSSHVLSELESLCDYVVMIDEGRCVKQGTLKEVTEADKSVRYTLSTKPDLDALGIELQGCSLTWSDPILTIVAPASQSIEETNRLCLPELLRTGAGIVGVQAGGSLEDSYMRTKNAPKE